MDSPAQIYQQILTWMGSGGAGFRGYLPALIAAMSANETAGFTSNVFKQNNNASGIMFAGQKNAVQGTPFPASEGKHYYAKFKTLKDWANAMAAIITRMIPQKTWEMPGTAANDPIGAYNFAGALKQKGYFTSDAKAYGKNILTWFQRLDPMYQKFKSTELYDPNAGIPAPPIDWKDYKSWPWYVWGGGGLALLLLLRRD